MLVVSSRNFSKAAARLPSKVKAVLKNRLEMFMSDPYASVLNNHRLHGSMRHYRSINITGDYRLIYEEYDDVTIRLIDIGTHGRIYGK
ncbi:MAG: type II toxin-antitoxin system mRNA interferase toxin, RelE/StbE family [Patescibacteria group bacterium]|nr:type II toxin-antitoxin system mRNA interferase toxin, RelE/StbE family [Patescibacteria group bacterium]